MSSKKTKASKLARRKIREAESKHTEPKLAKPIPGQPGYRTREGRTGYDPIDSRTEMGHVSGVALQRFFTGRLRTENPIYQILMGALGVALVLPLVLAIVSAASQTPVPPATWAMAGAAAVFGLLALANLVLSLARRGG